MLLERLLCHLCIGLWETQYFQRFELVAAEVLEHGPCLLCDVIDLLSGQKEGGGGGDWVPLFNASFTL
jgi:hypothetical protein